MKPSRVRLQIERLEDRTVPTAVVANSPGALPVDAGNFKMHFGNATFNTTSSANGFSEASMLHAQAVSTKNGGHVNSKLNDAFDGVLSFGINKGDPSTSRYHDLDGVVDLTTTSHGTTITSDPASHWGDTTFDGLLLSSQFFMAALQPANPDSAAYIRSLFTATNTTNEPITEDFNVLNNLGSDANTKIYATSSGDTAFQLGTDRWVGSFQNFSGTTSTDVRLLFGLQGTGTVRAPLSAGTTYSDGSDRPDFTYHATVNPGETVRFMLYTGLFASQQDGENFGATLNSTTAMKNAGLLADLTPQQLGQIINWNVAPTVAPTAKVTIVPSYHLNPFTGLMVGSFVITNQGSTLLNGPGTLMFPNLPPGVTIVGTVPKISTLAPGHSTVVTVTFTRASAANINLLLKADALGHVLYPVFASWS